MANQATSRTKFQALATCRIEEAQVLYDANHYDGAYYLAGYAVECALKAAICRNFQRHTLPELKRVKDAYQHSLTKLLALAELKDQLDRDGANDPGLMANWSTIKDWNPNCRYQKSRKLVARDLISAVGDGRSSFLHWVKRKW